MQLASLRAMDEAGVFFMYFLVSNYTDQSASLESASCLRRKRVQRDYIVAPESAGGQTILPTGSRAHWAVIFLRVSVL